MAFFRRIFGKADEPPTSPGIERESIDDLYASLDCLAFNRTFYMSESEAFLHYCRPYFHIQELDKAQENYKALCRCKKCASTFEFGWGRFSISVDRSYLKPLDLKATPIGAPTEQPIPFFIGLFGHSLPDKQLFRKVPLPEFLSYVKEV